MARAYGANASLLAAFETTYGSNPVGDYWKLPFVSTTLGSEQGLIANDLIGLGREPNGHRHPHPHIHLWQVQFAKPQS